jgi:SHS2 domain-containing protein
VFQVLEHPADVGFRATAPALPELFESAAAALVSIVLNPANVRESETVALAAQGDSIESLLVNWLSEVLYYLDGEHIAFARFQVREFTPQRIVAEGRGERRDPARHETRLVVKGVTWHQLKIEHHGQEWSCEVYLDV